MPSGIEAHCSHGCSNSLPFAARSLVAQAEKVYQSAKMIFCRSCSISRGVSHPDHPLAHVPPAIPAGGI